MLPNGKALIRQGQLVQQRVDRLRVRVKGWSKSPPHFRRLKWHGKPHALKCHVYRVPLDSAIRRELAARGVGRLTLVVRLGLDK